MKINTQIFIRVVIKSTPFIGLTTLFCGLVYVSVQQVYRQTANDQPLSLAHEIVNQLSENANPVSLVSTHKMKLDKTQNPFIIILDGSEKVVASNVEMNSEIPVPPKGVFETAKKEGEFRVTWQPENKIRTAAVIQYTKNPTEYYVLAGKSLNETEKRIEQLIQFCFIFWVLSVGFIFLFFVFKEFLPIQFTCSFII